MATQTQQPKKKALYCRLSKDDERLGESLSIETQKETLAQYAKEHGLFPVQFYIDDGYTGLNFERPAFQQMMDDISLGLIDTVITKDMSRLGRDHIKTGEYTDIFFPTHRIRYIAINDGYDSANQQSTYYGVLKQAINEFYSRDNSVKIKAAFKTRAKAGKYHATAAPFGYLKDPKDHNHLIPDPETAPYVVKIYELVLQGWGNHRIRDYLRETKVPIPTWFQHVRGITDRSKMFPDEEARYVWRPDTLRLLIRNPVYCGDTVMGRSEAIFKTRKHPRTEEEKWITVQDTHEPLVSREVWEHANKLIAVKRQDYKDSVVGGKNMFSGILKCADCGKALSRRKYGSASAKVIYVCGTYATYGVYQCSQHKIFEEDCYETVLSDIQRYARLAKDHRDDFIALILGYYRHSPENRVGTSAEELKRLNKRLAEINKAFDALYEDHLLERISDDNYERLSAKYQREQKDIKNQLALSQAADIEFSDKRTDAEKCADMFAEYADITELNAAIINALINRIDVFEPEVVDGVMKQTIRIHYRFADVIEPLDFDAIRCYKSEKVRQASQQRAARQRQDRVAAVEKEVTDNPIETQSA